MTQAHPDRPGPPVPPPPAVEALDTEIGPRDLQRFVTVLRGYDRIEVDECLGRIAVSVQALRAELAAQREALAKAGPRPTPEPAREEPPASSEGGFGVRAERLLRLAETEAREIRSHAATEAGALVEQARAEAERTRHESEQALIERSSAQDRQHATRMAELTQREEGLADQLAEIGRRADETRAATQREVDALREQVRADLAEARERAATEIARDRRRAGEEIERMEKVSAAMRGELRRLADVLAHELRDGPERGS